MKLCLNHTRGKDLHSERDLGTDSCFIHYLWISLAMMASICLILKAYCPLVQLLLPLTGIKYVERRKYSLVCHFGDYGF